MTATEQNPHKISTAGTGTSLAAITDASDFPHTGLIKGLSQMARQNIVVRNNTNDFDITQSSDGTTVTVGAGSYLRDGKLYTAQYKTGTTAASFTYGASELITTYDKGYHMIVIDINNFILVRKPVAANKVPDYTVGDTIIAIYEYSSTTSGLNRLVQYLTTDKVENSLSIAYNGGGTVYTEALSIESSASGDVTIEGKVSDKDIIFKANDGGASTEIMRIDSSVSRVGIGTNTPTAKLHVTDSGSGDHLLLEGTLGSSTTSAPNLVLFRNGADAAADIDDADLIGQIVFRGENDNSTPQEVNYATIEAGMDDTTDGSEDGHITFNLIEAGALTEFMRLRSATRDVVVNEQADDIDFRCEGSSDVNLLFVDASADKVGIGLNTPKTKLTVEGAITLKEQASADTDTAAYGQLWTKTATPNELYFTNDAGNDIQLTNGATGPLLTGKHTIWIPASSMTPTTTAGCANLVLVEMTAGRPELQVLDFAADADDHAQFTVAFPKSWNEGAVNFQPFWTVTGTNTGDVEWNLTGTSIANSGVINTAYPSASVSAGVAHSGTSNDLNVGAVCGGLTIGNAAVDTVTYFKLSNDTGSSTQTGVARLVGIKLFYDIVAGNDE